MNKFELYLQILELREELAYAERLVSLHPEYPMWDVHEEIDSLLYNIVELEKALQKPARC